MTFYSLKSTKFINRLIKQQVFGSLEVVANIPNLYIDFQQQIRFFPEDFLGKEIKTWADFSSEKWHFNS